MKKLFFLLIPIIPTMLLWMFIALFTEIYNENPIFLIVNILITVAISALAFLTRGNSFHEKYQTKEIIYDVLYILEVIVVIIISILLIQFLNEPLQF